MLEGARSGTYFGSDRRHLESRRVVRTGSLLKSGRSLLVLTTSMKIKTGLKPKSLNARIDRFFDLAAGKIRSIESKIGPVKL